MRHRIARGNPPDEAMTDKVGQEREGGRKAEKTKQGYRTRTGYRSEKEDLKGPSWSTLATQGAIEAPVKKSCERRKDLQRKET